MQILRLAALILIVGALQSLAGQIWLPLGLFDALTVIVVHQALRRSYEGAILTGAAAGLMQDSLSGGLLGLHAFSKTAAAAAVASLGRVVVIRGPLTESLLSGVAALGIGLVELGLLSFLDWPARESLWTIVGRGAVTALLALAFLSMRPWLLTKWRRWRRSPSSSW